jgi:two-component system sensor kinase FixL
LRKIQSFGDRVLTKEYDNLSDDGKDYVKRMLNAASRMQKLINDLLSFSRLTTKAKPFVKVDLNDVLKGVLSDLEISIEKTGTKIIAEHLPEIEAEPTQMRQLFQNLISNAIKFRKENEIPVIKIYTKNIQRQAHLTGTPGDEKTEVYFEDNGIGFNEKYLDKIFAIFQRLEGQKYEGSGIGLAVCRKIAIRHGGNITAHSEPGKGSVFIVTLALHHPQEKQND